MKLYFVFATFVVGILLMIGANGDGAESNATSISSDNNTTVDEATNEGNHSPNTNASGVNFTTLEPSRTSTDLNNTKPVFCSPHDIERYYKWDNGSKKWYFEENPCGFRILDRDHTLKLLRGKTIFFVGDSTVRNTALALLAQLCNPDHMLECAQVLAWRFMKADYNHAMSCEGAKRRPNDGNATLRANQCMDVHHSTHAISNLTAPHYYKDRGERKKMWKQAILPALMHGEFQGIHFMVLEAGCAGNNDGIWKVFDHLLTEKNVAKIPRKHDLLILSGGLHCTHTQYRSHPWYMHLKPKIREARKLSPVIWLEITHCLKGWGMARIKSGNRWMIDYRKLVTCDYVVKYVPIMNKAFNQAGAVISPTRFATQQIKRISTPYTPLRSNESNLPCPFADHLHPAPLCQNYLNQIHLQVMGMVFENPNYTFPYHMPRRTTPPTLEPLPPSSPGRKGGKEEEEEVKITPSTLQKKLMDEIRDAEISDDGGTMPLLVNLEWTIVVAAPAFFICYFIRRKCKS